MKWQRWGWALIPLAAGLVIAALFVIVPTLASSILLVRIDLGKLVIAIGAIVSLLVAAGIALWEWATRRCRREMAGLQAELAEQRRRFLQRLDHELKNPLTAIRAGLANVANGPANGPASAARQEALASVEAQVLRLSQLTAEIRKLAELETRALERAPVDVAKLLQQAVTMARDQPGVDARHLTLTLPQAPWPVPEILCDPDLLFLAIYNLLDNALKFTRPGDTVEVRAYDDPAFVVVQVADTGPGIPRDELPRVWEELYRGQGARGVPGSGLGLALARAIVERHGGRIGLRSRAGQGTVVTVRLPLS